MKLKEEIVGWSTTEESVGTLMISLNKKSEKFWPILSRDAENAKIWWSLENKYPEKKKLRK